MVLFIIGLVSGLVLPTVVGSVSELHMQGATERVMSACRRARCEACGSGLTHRLNFSTEAGTYWITCETEPLAAPGVFDRISESWGRTLTLPERIKFEEVSPDEVGTPAVANDEDSGADAVIEFFPDGRTTGAIICLGYADPDPDEDEPVLIRLDPATGQVEVITSEEREAVDSAIASGTAGSN